MLNSVEGVSILTHEEASNVEHPSSRVEHTAIADENGARDVRGRIPQQEQDAICNLFCPAHSSQGDGGDHMFGDVWKVFDDGVSHGRLGKSWEGSGVNSEHYARYRPMMERLFNARFSVSHLEQLHSRECPQRPNPATNIS